MTMTLNTIYQQGREKHLGAGVGVGGVSTPKLRLTLVNHEDEGLVVVRVEVGVLHCRLLLLADPFPFLKTWSSSCVDVLALLSTTSSFS
jgi:hypothetical protein